MRIYEEVCTKRKCDLCGEESDNQDESGSIWEENGIKVLITIKSMRVNYYGNGGDSVTCEIDLCPDCFEKQLMPWLESQGGNIEERYSSW